MPGENLREEGKRPRKTVIGNTGIGDRHSGISDRQEWNLAPLAYLPERKRFLVYGGKKYWSLVETLGLDDNEQPNFFLVDPASGKWEQLHEGEFQPFFHSCPFRQADVPGKVWAARDHRTGDDYRAEVGRFDPNTFQFEPLASFAKLDPITPEIVVHNSKIYIIHREDLLEFSLPR
jgi:hypothetical protein